MKKICFVVQRYGLEVNGGAEYLCRLYAERMARFYDVTVVTSCAIDYATWKNEYPEGEDVINGIKVLRFFSVKERDMQTFGIGMGQYIMNLDRDFCEDFEWLSDNGPVCPEMFRFIKENRQFFDVFIFMGYLYYSTTFCIQEVAEKSILISTAHDELPLQKCDVFHALFNLPAALIYLTEEERSLVHRKFQNERIQSIVTGAGIVLPAMEQIDAQKDIFLKNHFSKEDDYIIYVGRIDKGKSCDLLCESFIQYKECYGGNVKLILAGKSIMEIPQREDIIWVGFVSEEEKFALMKHAKALVLASQMESLSLVVLEAMTLGTPVIVNANCDVLKGHVDKSNAGLYFCEKEELVAIMRYLFDHQEVMREMGENGKRYVGATYSWDVIDRKLIDLIERVSVDENS